MKETKLRIYHCLLLNHHRFDSETLFRNTSNITPLTFQMEKVTSFVLNKGNDFGLTGC